MHHHNNVRNPHQIQHNSHIRPHNPMNMMPPRSQIIPYISTQPRDLNRLGPHIPQQHSQQRMNTQMHQNPQIHHSKNRIISNHNNNNNNSHNNNAVLHGTGILPGPSIKQQSTAQVHPQILQNISHNYQHKIITGNHHGKSTVQSIQQQPKLNDDKLKEQMRKINDSVQSHNHQQHPQHQHHNPRRNIPNHILNSKQNQLSHLPHQPQQQQQQQPERQHQKQQQQQQTNQKQKFQSKITLPTHNNSHQKILKNPNTPQIRKSPPTITTIPNVVTTSTPPKTTVSNATTITSNVKSNCPVPIISSQPKISNTIQPSVVENTSDKAASQNQMAPVSPVIEQQPKEIVSTTKEEYTCGQILQSPTIENYPNSKDKTPMCLVNELARFNKIGHQYRLTGEQGPAHSKRFTVTLKLGDEEYTADGPSIKKTQHTAASEAIAKTKYEHPPAKTIRHKNGNTRNVIATLTPTVELNALAMKLGEPTIYVFDSSTSTNNSQSGGGNNSNGASLPPHHHISNNYSHQQTQGSNVTSENGQYQVLNHRNNIYLNGGMHPRYSLHRGGRGAFGQRGAYLKYNQNARLAYNGMLSGYAKDACKITLMVGKKKFVGTGPTIQSAKHDAAAKALEILKPLGEQIPNQDDNVTTDIEDPNSDNKSPISVVHEMALKRNLTVTFTVKSETGPPHMKVFRTICTVGTIVTDGEGNGKKISKKRAAEKMLDELKKIPPIVIERPVVVAPITEQEDISNGKIGKVKNPRRLSAVQYQGQTPTTGRKKSKNLIKENPEAENNEVYNPVLKLTKIQQMLKEKEPTYTILEERGAPRRREFVIMVTAGNMSTEGAAYSKKLAKKNAAKNLLALMGYDEPVAVSNKENDSNVVNTAEKSNDSKIDKTTQPQKEIVNNISVNNSNNSPSKTAVSQSGNSSRQIVPGIIHLPQNKINSTENDQTKQNNKILQPPEQQEQNLSDNLNESQNNNVANKSPSPPPPIPQPQPEPPKADSPILEKKVSSSTDFAVRPKDQLLYLAQLLGFQAVFSDYPKGNHGEYLTIVTLSTDPPQICHGAGADTDASQDIAARTALQMLSKLGLDNVCPKEKTSSSQKNSSKVLAAADSSKN